MSKRPETAAAARTARGRTLFRSAPPAGFVGFALIRTTGRIRRFDALARRAIHGSARPPRCRIRRKINDGASLAGLSGCRFRRDPARDMPSLRSGRG